MTTDDTLKSLEQRSSDKIEWGNYDHHYDWQWTDRPLLVPKTLNITSAVMVRDWTIARKLQELGIKKVLDIGSDTGHFMAVLKFHGIDSVGIDANKKSCEFINSKKQNTCYNIGFQTLLTLPKLNEYDCIVCMNITQAKWPDENLKNELIEWICKNTKFAVLSDMTHQDKKWGNLMLIQDFNVLPFYFSKSLYRVLNFFNVSIFFNYLCIQKIYKVKK